MRETRQVYLLLAVVIWLGLDKLHALGPSWLGAATGTGSALALAYIGEWLARWAWNRVKGNQENREE